MEKVEVVIIGAGIVGLSVACEISSFKDSVYLLERHESFGQEASSRNSEVIHAGIYYPKDFLKARTCIEGKKLIYEQYTKKSLVLACSTDRNFVMPLAVMLKSIGVNLVDFKFFHFNFAKS